MCLVMTCPYCKRSASWRRLTCRPVRCAYLCRRCECIYDSRSGRWIDWVDFTDLLEVRQIEEEWTC
jgi:hypothetical protein